MDQLARISAMEERLSRAAGALCRLDAALADLETLRQDVAVLAAYDEGPLWRADFEADERGLLPPDLRRGVLSEDAVYDLLTQYKELLEFLRQAAE